MRNHDFQFFMNRILIISKRLLGNERPPTKIHVHGYLELEGGEAMFVHARNRICGCFATSEQKKKVSRAPVPIRIRDFPQLVPAEAESPGSKIAINSTPTHYFGTRYHIECQKVSYTLYIVSKSVLHALYSVKKCLIHSISCYFQSWCFTLRTPLASLGGSEACCRSFKDLAIQ